MKVSPSVHILSTALLEYCDEDDGHYTNEVIQVLAHQM